MKKFLLRIALSLGLLVGLTLPALAQQEDYIRLKLTVSTSQYKGGHGTVALATKQNVATPTHGAFGATQTFTMDADSRDLKKPNTLQIYAKADPGYHFVHWADADSKTTQPAAASTDKKVLYTTLGIERISRKLTKNTGTEDPTNHYYSTEFQFLVNGLFIFKQTLSHTLYAVFEPETYTINFNADGGTVTPASKTVMFNDPYGALPTPTKAGYTFAGWFNAGGQQIFPTTIKGAGDATETLTAHWTENTYTIHFVDLEANDGAGHLLHTNIPNTAYSLATSQMPNLATSTYQFSWDTANKYFAGYYTQPNGLGVRVYKGIAAGDNLAKGDAFTPTGETTLYAHYTHIHHNMYWDYTYYGFSRDYHNLRQEDGTNRIRNARLTFKRADGSTIKRVILYADVVTNKTDTLTEAFASHTTSLANIKLWADGTTPTADNATVSGSGEGAARAHNVYFTEEDLAAFRSYTFEPLNNAATPVVPIEWVAVTEKDKHETILTYMGAADPAHNYSQKWSVTLSGLLINPDVIYVMPLFNNKENTGTWAGISQLDKTLGVPCAKENDHVINSTTGAREATYNGSFLVWNGYNNAIGLVGFTLGGQTYYMNTTDPGVFSDFYNSATAASPQVANPGTNNETVGKDIVIKYTVPATAIPVIRFLPEGGVLSSTTPSYFVSAYNANVDLSGYSATRAGYTLSGWLDEETDATIATDGQITANRAHTLHAQWQGLPYKVTLDPNSGEGGLANVTAHYQEAMPTIEVGNLPTRPGYDFQGFWDIHDVKYYNADGTSAHAYDKMEASTLYAGWKAHTYTVTLNPNDGISSTSAVTATYDAVLPHVAVPTWANHTFLGYFDGTNENATMYINAEGNGTHLWDKTDDNVTLYAHWMKELYTIVCHSNFAPDTTHVRSFDPDAPTTWNVGVYAGMPIPDGKRFMGWNTQADGLGTSYSEKQHIDLTGNIDLYAQWAPNPSGYTLWYGTHEFNAETWKSMPFTPSTYGDHHVWESGHIVITEDFKVEDDKDVAHEIHYFVVAGDINTPVTSADTARKQVMGYMGVAPCNEEDGTCRRTVHDLILPEDSVGHELHPEQSERAAVYGHFHIWTSHTEACNFACHMVRDFFLDYHSNFPYGLPDRTYEQIVEFETGTTTIKGNEFHMADFPAGLLTFNGWNTKADGSGTAYTPGQAFVFPADSTHNIRLYAQWIIDPTKDEHFVQHWTGTHYGTMLDNGMQRVHTYDRTIYINPNETVRVYRPDWTTYRQYVRWYNFDTDHGCPNLIYSGNFSANREFDNRQGKFFVDQNAEGTVNFCAPDDFKTDIPAYEDGVNVACDQSAYADGKFLSFGFQYSRMVWYFFGFDVTGANPENAGTEWRNPRKLTKADLDAMSAGDVKYIYIVKPNNGGFVWFWSGAHNGASINPITEAGIANNVEKCRTISNRNGYRMKLTKRTDGGITIQTLSTQGSSHSGDYLSITADKHFTFANTTNDSVRVWYYSNPGRDINETNLNDIDGSRNNTSLLYLRNIEDDYLYTNPASWKDVAGSVAANLPSGTHTVGNTEPTLSQRLLFHIKPATIMADSMKKYISAYPAVNGLPSEPDKQSMREPYMEEQHMIVPTGQTFWAGPSLQYIRGDDNSFPYFEHTYCFYDHPTEKVTPTMCVQGVSGSWQWKKNGVNHLEQGQPTVAAGRFAQFPASNEVRTDTLTLQFYPNVGGRVMNGKAYNVCRIIVEYMPKTTVGPSNTLGYDAVSNAVRVAYEDFNINPRTGKFVGNAETHDFSGTPVRFYTRALPYEESVYGFYDGSRTVAHYGGGNRRWFPFWGEYGLVSNSATAWGVNNVVANHDESETLDGQNRETGYSIYIDGSAIPGEVFELDVDNLKLCANSKMYCSAWVASVTQSSYTKPNFDFEVFAYNKATGMEHIVTTFNTGELDYNDAGDAPHAWQHILFPVTYHNEVGAVGHGDVQFRVRVINKGKNSRGNDFMIDDIGFFVKQPDFKAIQANVSSCLQTGQEERMPLYLRVDYEQLVASDPEHPHEYYYAWFDEKHQAVVADHDEGYFWLDGGEPDGAEIAAGADTTKMGKIRLSASLDGKPTYNSFKEFDQHITEQLTAGTLRAQRAYVKEKGKDNLDHYFLYIVQPLTVKANHTYHAAMSTDIHNVVAGHSHDDPCTMVTHLDIIAGARIRVDGEVFTHETDICGNRTYELDVQMSYVLKVETDTTVEYKSYTVDCNADWLKGNRSTIANNPALYGLSSPMDSALACDTIIHAIIASHTAFTEAEHYDYNQARQDIVNYLRTHGLLVQNVSKFIFHPTPENPYYMAFARARKADEHASHICPEPQEIFFDFPAVYRHGVIIGTSGEDAPDPVINNPRVIRVQHNVINHDGTFSFPLYQAVGEHQEALDGFVITAAESIERDTAGLPLYALTARTFTRDGHTSLGSVPTSGDCIVDLTGDCLRNIQDGEYNFALLMEVPSTLEENACDIRYAYFKLIVTPDILNWNPTVSVWNADNAWTDADNHDLHYVPLPTTQVIMPKKAETVKKPESPATVEDGAQEYITYDIYGDTKNVDSVYYRPYSCSDIYFPVGASLMNQTQLNIGGKAYIDVQFTASKWQLASFPIHGVVSGDIFTPMAEVTDPANPFSVAEISSPADRYKHQYYQNLYNASVMNTTGSGSCEELVHSSTWLTNADYSQEHHTSGHTANGLAIPYGYAETGYQAAAAFYLVNNTDAACGPVRLPKKADVTYSYYDKNTNEWIGYLSDVITRSNNANYSKPVYTNGNGQTFTLHGSSNSNVFLFGNPTFAYIDMDKFLLANASVLNGVSYKYNGTSHVTGHGGIYADGSTNSYLPPYSAVLVQTKDEATSVAVVVADSMLLDTIPTAPAAPARASHLSPQGESWRGASSTIFMSMTSGGFTTYAMAEETPDASNLYDEKEDADVFLMAPSQTPFVFYTGSDGHAMAINRHRSLNRLPISFYTQQTGDKPKVSATITFTGDERYLGEWDLQLIGTTKVMPLSNDLSVKISWYRDGTPTAVLVHSRPGRVTTNLSSEDDSDLHVYSQGGLVVCCADRNMHSVEVFSPAGKLLHSAVDVQTYYEIPLPTGVYLVRVDGKVFKVFND